MPTGDLKTRWQATTGEIMAGVNLRVVERCVYTDGEFLHVRVSHVAWGGQKHVCRMPLANLEEARQCRDALQAASVMEVERVADEWRRTAYRLIEESGKFQRTAKPRGKQ